MTRFMIDPSSLAREEPVRFDGPTGVLEGLWRPAPPGRAVRGAAVVAHPHPAFGGTMLNKVVFHTARVLNHDLALGVLRFNFRGVGGSAGAYDEGRGEQEDLLAAWAEARRRVPGDPLVAAGFSFGAAMSLLAGARDAARIDPPAAFALLGLPFRRFRFPEPYPLLIPLAAVHGEKDEYTPVETVRAYLDGWPAPRVFHVEAGADHFFEGRLPAVTGFLSRTVGAWVAGA